MGNTSHMALETYVKHQRNVVAFCHPGNPEMCVYFSTFNFLLCVCFADTELFKKLKQDEYISIYFQMKNYTCFKFLKLNINGKWKYF